MAGWQEFAGLNRGYVLELYEKYRNDPASVDAETRAVFEQWTPPAESAAVPDGLAYDKIVGAAPRSKRRGAGPDWRGRSGASDIPPQIATPSVSVRRSVIPRCCRKPTK